MFNIERDIEICRLKDKVEALNKHSDILNDRIKCLKKDLEVSNALIHTLIEKLDFELIGISPYIHIQKKKK